MLSQSYSSTMSLTRRFESLTDKSELDAQPELFIHNVPHKATTTLTNMNSGICMSKSYLVNNLGTIARSGTRYFMEALAVGVWCP